MMIEHFLLSMMGFLLASHNFSDERPFLSVVWLFVGFMWGFMFIKDLFGV